MFLIWIVAPERGLVGLLALQQNDNSIIAIYEWVHCIFYFIFQGEREVGTAGKLLLLGMEDGSFDALDIYNRKKVL